MNKTRIETCDYTWNPVTGCWGPGGAAEKPNRCSYCYAEKKAKRRMLPYEREGDPFRPLFHPERLLEPGQVKMPQKIFVCSVSDLFGDWVPDEWIQQIIGTAWFVAPHHIYQFLTKNPKRLLEFNPWPSNCWVGCTITNQADADEQLHWLLQVDAPVRFVSHEPLLGAIDVGQWAIPGLESWCEGHPESPNPSFPGGYSRKIPGIQWAIIGGMTGPGAVKPKTEWVAALANTYHDAGVPIFMKNNLKPPMGRLVQE